MNVSMKRDGASLRDVQEVIKLRVVLGLFFAHRGQTVHCGMPPTRSPNWFALSADHQSRIALLIMCGHLLLSDMHDYMHMWYVCSNAEFTRQPVYTTRAYHKSQKTTKRKELTCPLP